MTRKRSLTPDTWHLVGASLRHYALTHAMVIAGVAVAVAVLAGALLVGSSVRTSLRDLALGRFGNTGVVVSSPTFFREALATDIGGVPVVALAGAVVHERSGRTARVQIYGIDDRFTAFHDISANAPSNRQARISTALAEELGATPGDELLVRLAKPTDIPLSTLQGRREEAGQRIRFTLERVIDRDQRGEFSLSPAQGPALTLFVSLARLQRELDLAGRVNVALVDYRDAGAPVEQRVRAQATLDDYGLRIRQSTTPAAVDEPVIVESRAGVMSDALFAAMRKFEGAAVLTHLANTIRVGDREIPYSVVAATPLSVGSTLDFTLPPIVLNQWAAEDLGAKPGDRVTLEYYVWSDEAGLESRSTDFEMAGIEPMNRRGGDRTFTPQYPGLTDAADVASWDPPFPVDLKRVRPKDEAYWDRWQAAPKAFIQLAIGQKLWGTPHGRISSFRISRTAAPIDPASGQEPETSSAFVGRIEETILRAVTPAIGGIQIINARADALAAADGTTDFGEYFVYFSFFLVVSGLLLAGLFFALSVEQRAREAGVLGAIGFSPRSIRRLLLAESAALAIVGAIVGVIGAVAYAALIMHGLRTWWVDSVGTTALELHIDPVMLAAGTIGALIAAVVALTLSFRRVTRRSPRALIAAGLTDGGDTGLKPTRHLAVSAIGLVAVAVVLIATAAAGVLNQVAVFFGAGGLMLLAGLVGFMRWLRNPSPTLPHATLARLGVDYSRWRPGRSVLSAALIAFACFVLVAVAAFQRDASAISLERSEGTGGFVLMAESVAPLLHNPNINEGREQLGIVADPMVDRMRVTRFRLRPGDEASCLTLYKPTNPRIIAPEPAFVSEGRFTFAASMAESAEERANPWLLLNRRFADGAIPTVADQTSLTYVFHLQVGDDFVFTPNGTTPLRLRIVGALADSMLQSELIVSEDRFVSLFPRHEGYRVWMIDASVDDANALATRLEDRLADFGVDVVDTRARLAAYHRVENTYLSTFQALGALGLLLGTIGLAAVLARNVLERRRELGLLGAIGFTRRNVRTLVLAESLVLVGLGVTLGTVTALVAVAPALIERRAPMPSAQIGFLLVAVVATGLSASLVAARAAMHVGVVDAMKNE